jgi:hypothetical protein
VTVDACEYWLRWFAHVDGLQIPGRLTSSWPIHPCVGDVDGLFGLITTGQLCYTAKGCLWFGMNIHDRYSATLEAGHKGERDENQSWSLD